MSEITGIRVPTPQPTTASTAATSSTRPGAAIEKARARRAALRAPTRARPWLGSHLLSGIA